MINWPYVRFIWKSHRGFVFFSTVAIAAMPFFAISLVSSMETGAILQVLLEQLPERFRSLINDQFLAVLTVKGAAAFVFQHPLVLTLLTINAIHFSNRHIAGEMESGTLELLLSYPFRRRHLLFSLWAASSLALLFIVCGEAAASISAVFWVDKLNADIFFQLLKIAANLWLLCVFISSFTLLLTTFAKQGSKIGLFGAAVVLIFYLLDLLSTLSDALRFIEPINIFTYYQPQKLMFNQSNFGLNVVVLTSLIVICVLIGIKQFNRRDIPGS